MGVSSYLKHSKLLSVEADYYTKHRPGDDRKNACQRRHNAPEQTKLECAVRRWVFLQRFNDDAHFKGFLWPPLLLHNPPPLLSGILSMAALCLVNPAAARVCSTRPRAPSQVKSHWPARQTSMPQLPPRKLLFRPGPTRRPFAAPVSCSSFSSWSMFTKTNSRT